MNRGARIFLEQIRSPEWFDNVAARVSISLLLLVILAIPTFLLLVHNPFLVAYYMIYPAVASFALYLRYRGHDYASSVLLVLSVYGIVGWMAWLIGIEQVNQLQFWIISLLPWVMFEDRQKITLGVLMLIPVVFSFVIRFLPSVDSPLFPAEREFVSQMLSISVAMGAFSCIYFLRRQQNATEKKRLLENEFYSNTLNNIPLPIIIKDGITLDYVFYNSAAELTFDLRQGYRHSNQSTFSETCASTVSRLDHEVMRSVTFHVESDESLVHHTGLNWHFRTYRIPLELRSSGRRLLITIGEDLRAINLLLRKAEDSQALLENLRRLLSPLVVRYDRGEQRVQVQEPAQANLAGTTPVSDICAYLAFFFSRSAANRSSAMHQFQLGNDRFLVFYGPITTQGYVDAVVIAMHP